MASVLMGASMWGYRALYWRPLERAAASPQRAQRQVLARLLSANAETQFANDHHFASIRTVDDFRERIPVHEYEQLRPYIDEQRRTGRNALTREAPLFYAQTSGSTGAPKLVPITPSMLRLHKQEQALFSYLQYRACPEAFAGKAWGIMGAAVEGRLDSGHTVGSVSGHLYRSLPRVIQRRFVVPPEVSTIGDYETKYLVILRLALNEPRITYLGTPNPSTFLRLLDVLDTNRDLLARSVESGRFDILDGLDRDVREAVRPRLSRSLHMARCLAKDGDLTFADLWPEIRLVTTWTGGSCGIALNRLRATLPSHTRVMELGYQSTEFRGSIALDTETAAGIPPLHHHFFEFVEQSSWDAQQPTFLTLDQLQQGRTYYVIVTTASGLYRYFMNDLVAVDGSCRSTPLIRFLQKGKGVTSMTGEKLYESQVIESVSTTLSRHGCCPAFFTMIADEQAGGYRVFVELGDGSSADSQRVAQEIDDCLGRLNIEYHGKRVSGRLRPLDVVWLRDGTGEAFKASCVRAGQREGQFKHVALQYRKDLRFPLEEYARA